MRRKGRVQFDRQGMHMRTIECVGDCGCSMYHRMRTIGGWRWRRYGGAQVTIGTRGKIEKCEHVPTMSASSSRILSRSAPLLGVPLPPVMLGGVASSGPSGICCPAARRSAATLRPRACSAVISRRISHNSRNVGTRGVVVAGRGTLAPTVALVLAMLAAPVVWLGAATVGCAGGAWETATMEGVGPRPMLLLAGWYWLCGGGWFCMKACAAVLLTPAFSSSACRLGICGCGVGLESGCLSSIDMSAGDVGSGLTGTG